MLASLVRQLFTRSTAGPSIERAAKLLDEGAAGEASAEVARVLAAQPRHAAALRLRARIAFGQKRYGAALRDYEAALALEPGDAATLLEAGRVQYELSRFEEALELTRRAAASAPRDAHAHYCRGLMLRELGRYEEAHDAMLEALRADACSHEASCGLALVLVDLARHDDAERILRSVLEEDPRHAVARWQLAMALLLRGRFAEAWSHYEARWHLYDTLRPRNLPFWDGGTKPSGPLLVLAEQGLGDEILFASCFRDLMCAAGKVIIECDARLGPLFARSFPGAAVWPIRHAHGQAPEPAHPVPEMQIAAGSLPALYRAAPEAFPEAAGYLRADEAKRARWSERLARLGPGVKVGLSWRGGTAHTRAALRSLPLAQLSALLGTPGVQWVSLQYGEVAHDIAAIANDGHAIQHWPEALADCDETAALVCALDLVVTVQTAAAHLAGALGRPVWILVPASPEWRYMAAGDRLPWYPTARLFRQQKVGQWDGVVAEVTRCLGSVVRAGAQ